MPKKIYVFWSDNNGIPNFGDELNPYLVERLTGYRVKFADPRKSRFKKIFIVIGSVLGAARTNSHVWGAGIISKEFPVFKAKYYAVRGKETKKILEENGINAPTVFGDPALLLPKFYIPKTEKRYELGIIPHYVDFDSIKERFKEIEGVKIIDLTHGVENVVEEIFSCRKTISSSLHGIIVSHAYKIPCLWYKFSDNLFGDDIKFYDYFSSVGIPYYEPFKLGSTGQEMDQIVMDFQTQEKVSVIQVNLEFLLTALLDVCPFPLREDLTLHYLDY